MTLREREPFREPPEIRKEEFGDNQIKRFSKVNKEISLLESKEDLSEEEMKKLLELEREYTELDISRKKKIRELIGPQFPLTMEWTLARNLGKEGKLWEKYNEKRGDFKRKIWIILPPKEREERERKAVELQGLPFDSSLEDRQRMKRPDWFNDELLEVIKERDQREAEELWYLSPLEYKEFLSKFKGWKDWLTKLETKEKK